MGFTSSKNKKREKVEKYEKKQENNTQIKPEIIPEEKSEKISEFKTLKFQELRALLIISQLKLILYRIQKTDIIEQEKKELIQILKKDDINSALAKDENIFKEENYIIIYDILDPILEQLKDECIIIVSKKEFPSDKRALLDSVLYSAPHINIKELNLFREEVITLYGLEFVNKIDSNSNKTVDEYLLDLLEKKVYSEELKINRLQELCIENKINCSLNEIKNLSKSQNNKQSEYKNINASIIPKKNDENDDLDQMLRELNDPYYPYGSNTHQNNINNSKPLGQSVPYSSHPQLEELSKNEDQGDDDLDEMLRKLNGDYNYYENNENNKNQKNEIEVLTQITSDINGLYSKTQVTQIFMNPYNEPSELKIFILKKTDTIFSSFDCQIGDSIKVKSKVIKEEKAQEKYSDTIASGNAAIFVSYDPSDENKITINMGNVPPKADIIFISYFISPIRNSNNKYEFEIFKNLPIILGKLDYYHNSETKGEININSKYEIRGIEKNILMDNLNIIEEKFYSLNPYSYKIKYEIKKLPSYNRYNQDYIPSSTLNFELGVNQPLAFAQESDKIKNEKYYFIKYHFNQAQNMPSNKDYQELSHSLFIILLDQSNSMKGEGIKSASIALLLFLKSIPEGSYYQIIGFGSDFKKYDKTPKKNNIDNILKSIDLINNLEENLGEGNIYEPLKDIFESNDYNDIYLPGNIFILTNGNVNNQKEVLNLIEANNSKFRIYSFGIGNYFDHNFIKNAAIVGKGNYNFCINNDKLSSAIASNIEKCCRPFKTKVKVDCNLENNKINNIIPKYIRDNDSINLYYINDDKIYNKIKLEIKYKDYKNNEYKQNHEINPEIIEKGDDLSKLIIYDYIKNNINLSKEEKIKLALKYQILIKGTSLFAQVELNGKIVENMKLHILGENEEIARRPPIIHYISRPANYQRSEDDQDMRMLLCNKNMDDGFNSSDNYNKNKISKNDKDVKDEFIEMINTQDFIEGYWKENEYTKKIIKKYEKEFKLIKGLKNKNIDDKTAITIIIIYFINKEHPKKLDSLLMIIKKAKIYIQKTLNDTYENIIKQANIN